VKRDLNIVTLTSGLQTVPKGILQGLQSYWEAAKKRETPAGLLVLYTLASSMKKPWDHTESYLHLSRAR
jgi:hypothetical protein